MGPGAGIRAPDRPAGRLLFVRMVFNKPKIKVPCILVDSALHTVRHVSRNVQELCTPFQFGAVK